MQIIDYTTYFYKDIFIFKFPSIGTYYICKYCASQIKMIRARQLVQPCYIIGPINPKRLHRKKNI